MHRLHRSTALALLIATSGSSQAFGQAAPDDYTEIPIEEAMREINARHRYVSGEYRSWPSCDACSLGIASPMPDDETFDGALADPERARDIVQDVVEAFYDLPEDFVNPNSSDGVSNYTLADIATEFPRTWDEGPGGEITDADLQGIVETIIEYTQTLGESSIHAVFSFGNRTYEDWYRLSTWTGTGTFEARCPQWFSETSALTPTYTTSTPTAGNPYLFQLWEPDASVGGPVLQETIRSGSLSGTVDAAHDGQTLKIYLRVSSTWDPGILDYPDDLNPPVVPDDTWRLWHSAVASEGTFTSPMIQPSRVPVAVDNSCVYGTGASYGSFQARWTVEDFKVVYAINFDTSPMGGCVSGCGSGACELGSGAQVSVSEHGAQGHLSLGSKDGETPAGGLVFRHARGAAAMTSPSSLVPALDPSLAVSTHLILDSNDAVRQVWTEQMLVDVVTVSADQFEVRYYEASAKGALNNGVYTVSGTPFRKVVFEDPDASDARLRVTQHDDAGVTRVDEFYWDSAAESWTLAEGLDTGTPSFAGAIRQTVVSSVYDAPQTTRTDTFLTREPDGGGFTTLGEAVEVHTQYAFGWELTERRAGPTGNQRIERWTYFTSPADDGYGRLKSYESPSGYWERYVYDTDGDLVHTISQTGTDRYDDTATDTALAAAHRVVERDALVVNALVGGQTEDVTVIKTTESVAGDVVSVGYLLCRSSSSVAGAYEQWSVRSVTPDPESGTSTTGFVESILNETNTDGHRVNKTWKASNGLHQYEVVRVESHDGQVTEYDRSGANETVVARGYLDGNGDYIHATRTTTVTSDTGTPLRSLTEMIRPAVNPTTTGGPFGGTIPQDWFVASMSLSVERDAFDRVLQRGQYQGDDAASMWAWAASNQASGYPEDLSGVAGYVAPTTLTSTEYGCCGVSGRTDAAGVASTYTQNSLGWQTVADDGGVTMTYGHDGAGRVTSVTRDGTLVRTTEYDASGRVAEEADALGNKRFFTHRYVNASGTTVDPNVTTGVFYSETRAYPHNKASGPISVTWTNSQGQSVLTLTGTVSSDWSGFAPTSIDALSEVFSRTLTAYDTRGRVSASEMLIDAAAFSLGDLVSLTSLDNATDLDGDPNDIDYDRFEPETVYDFEGRMVRTIDRAGDITVQVYDDLGRVTQTWVGTDDNVSNPSVDPTVYDDPGALGGDLVQVASMAYDAYGELDASRSLLPKATLTSFTGDSIASSSEEGYTVSGSDALTGRTIDSIRQDALSPITRQTFDERGRATLTQVYANNGLNEAGTLLAQNETVYYDASAAVGSRGRVHKSRVYRVENGTASTYLETVYLYDAQGRQARVTQPTGAYTLTEYDDLGRVLLTVLGTDDGGTALDPSDDIIVTEAFSVYNAADQVELSVSLERRHDAEASDIGRLWDESGDEPEDFAVARYSGYWYDASGRMTHAVDYGDAKP